MRGLVRELPIIGQLLLEADPKFEYQYFIKQRFPGEPSKTGVQGREEEKPGRAAVPGEVSLRLSLILQGAALEWNYTSRVSCMDAKSWALACTLREGIV